MRAELQNHILGAHVIRFTPTCSHPPLLNVCDLEFRDECAKLITVNKIVNKGIFEIMPAIIAICLVTF